jgi:uncharacterized membrane protein (UPF0127 family)
VTVRARTVRRTAAGAVAGAAIALAACGPAPLSVPAPTPEPTSSAESVPEPPAPPSLGTAADALPAARVVLVRPDGSQVAVDVRVAATPAARSRGLQGVTALPSGAGMLFTFPEAAAHGGFWMQGTLVPLDIAFVAAGEVIAVATMRPCPADPCPITRPDGPYDAALEVPAGWLGDAGVGPGARLRVLDGAGGPAGQ